MTKSEAAFLLSADRLATQGRLYFWTFTFAEVGLFTGGAGAVRVHSVYEDTTLATTNASSFTVPGVPWQGTVLLRLSSVVQQ